MTRLINRHLQRYMRILIYSYNYHPEPIGIAPLMTELAEGLVKRGHQVRVVTAMPNYPQRRIYDEYQGKFYLTEERNGVTIDRSYVRIKGPNPSLLDRLLLDGSFMVTSFPLAFKGGRPDVMLSTSPPLPICVPVALCGWLRRVPVVLNIQDIVSEAGSRVGLLKKSGLLSRAVDALEKFAYRTAQRVSVIDDGFKPKLVSQGVPESKIVTIANWVDVKFIQPWPQDRENQFRRDNQLNGKFVVLYAGNIALTQGLETAIQAAAQLQQIREIAFVIVGEKSALGKLQEFCSTHKADNVKLLPFQPREKLPEMLGAADVGLVLQKERVTDFNLPSKIPVLLASGKAILASVPARGTAAKAIKNSGGGVVVAPEDHQALADQIEKLYRDRALVKKLGSQGRNYAMTHYSFEQALTQYEAVFAALTEKKPNRLLERSSEGR